MAKCISREEQAALDHLVSERIVKKVLADYSQEALDVIMVRCFMAGIRWHRNIGSVREEIEAKKNERKTSPNPERPAS